MGPVAGGAAEPAQAAEPAEELDGAVEPDSDAGRAETPPGCSLGLEEDEDEPSVAEPIPPAVLQPQERPVPLPHQAEQHPSDEQPPPMEQEARDGDSPLPAEDKEPPEADPPHAGSGPEQGGSPEVAEEQSDAAEVPLDIPEDPDLLEIVEQALEFNQEVVMGARAAEGKEQGPGGTQDAGEDSSPTSSSEEEPTVQEAPADAAPQAPVRAENGLHRAASLEDLAEFSEEVPNGITGTAPAFPMENTDPAAAVPAPGDATGTKVADASPCGKHGDTVRAEQEPCSMGNE